MKSHNKSDLLPKNYQELLLKYRKQEPVVLAMGDLPKSIRKTVNSGLQHYTGEWSSTQRAHLLKRCMFGIDKDDLNSVDSLSMDEIVEMLFQQREVTPPVNDYNEVAEAEDPDVPFGETWVNAKHGNDWEGPRTVSLKVWLIRKMLLQPVGLEEKMVFFWHNLLPIQTWGIFFGKLSYQYFDMLRRNAFGNFKTMIRELTLNPAMLIYLNGAFNIKEAPDENYARELQELFCIGKGPNAKFTEGDVQMAARVLTGWTFDWEKWETEGELEAVFVPEIHDSSDKTFSSFYNDQTIAGRSGVDAAVELDEMLDMIFSNQETALYICRRFYQFFVYPEIDDTVEKQVIAPLAELFRNHNYEIKPVLEALLKSEHFYDHANIGAMIKSPPEYIFGLWRAFGVNTAEEDDLTANFLQHQGLLWYMSALGAEIGDPPSVSGWPAYYQEPSFDKYWITTDTIANRAIASDSLVFWGFWVHEDLSVPADLIAFVKGLTSPADPNEMLRETTEIFHGIPVDEVIIGQLKKILLSGQDSDVYWTAAWQQLMADPDNEEYKLVVENRLKATFQYLLQMGESQLM